MFTGIIYHTATLLSTHPTPTGLRLELTNPFPPGDPIKLGESIANNGCCLTVAGISGSSLSFDAIPETLDKTNLGSLKPGDKVHMERSLRAGDRIDGHFVQGHVDGTGELLSVHASGEWRGRIRVPAHLARYLVPKGSIAVDGVSLTIAAIGGQASDEFEITLIPTTLELTTLGSRQPGYRFNIECDATVKTIVATLERMNISPGSKR